MNFNVFEVIYDGDLPVLLELLRNEPEQAKAIRVEDSMTPLILACENDQPEFVNALLASGADPNECMDDGESPLHIAAFEGSEKCAQHLIRAGADSNASTVDGKTPLMNAAQRGSREIVCALIEAHADPRAIDAAGRSALHWSAVGEHDDGAVVRILIDRGANQGQRNQNGDTAYDYAQEMTKPNLVAEFTRS